MQDVRKPRDQVYKMLELLEKRGPNAYKNFVWILRENFCWLADELEETYTVKQQGRSKTFLPALFSYCVKLEIDLIA